MTALAPTVIIIMLRTLLLPVIPPEERRPGAISRTSALAVRPRGVAGVHLRRGEGDDHGGASAVPPSPRYASRDGRRRTGIPWLVATGLPPVPAAPDGGDGRHTHPRAPSAGRPGSERTWAHDFRRQVRVGAASAVSRAIARSPPATPGGSGPLSSIQPAIAWSLVASGEMLHLRRRMPVGTSSRAMIADALAAGSGRERCARLGPRVRWARPPPRTSPFAPAGGRPAGRRARVGGDPRNATPCRTRWRARRPGPVDHATSQLQGDRGAGQQVRQGAGSRSPSPAARNTRGRRHDRREQHRHRAF